MKKILIAFLMVCAPVPALRAEATNLLQLKAGFFRPRGMVIENAAHQYVYGAESLKTFLWEGGWDQDLFSFLGRWGLKTQMGYTFIKARMNSAAYQDQPYATHVLHIMPAGAALTYGLQFWPRQWVVPYAEGGAQYYFYVQSGDTGGVYTHGGVFHPFWSSGLRVSLHDIFDLDSPFFLEAQYREIVSNRKSGIDLAHQTYFAGFSIGI